MDCDTFKANIDDYFDDSLNKNNTGEFEEHMKVCNECFDLYLQERELQEEYVVNVMDEQDGQPELHEDTIKEITTKMDEITTTMEMIDDNDDKK